MNQSQTEIIKPFYSDSRESRSKIFLVGLCFLLGMGFHFFLLFITKDYLESELWIRQVEGFLVVLFGLGGMIAGIFIGIDEYFGFFVLSPFLNNIFFYGLANGLFYSIFGLLIWKGIYQKKITLIYLVGGYFFVMTIVALKIVATY